MVGHATKLMLNNCKFVINKFGKRRFLHTKTRNVHAWIIGFISLRGGMGVDAEGKLPAKITYDPAKDIGFMCKNLTTEPFVVNEADVVILNQHGVTGSYINKI